MKRILLFLLLCALAGPGFAQKGPATPTSPYADARLTYKIIPAAGGTWCYDIYADGRMMIHQPSIPGMPGNAGFKTKTSAEKVAQLVVRKIKTGLLPPSVALDELKSLKAI
ncbi:MAG: DUF4907 domain-containing protein [Chitinophagaceae bacterium]|nr:MAG: DUF4907 domain-containing protein [Chitinophagaceae bacterium]